MAGSARPSSRPTARMDRIAVRIRCSFRRLGFPRG